MILISKEKYKAVFTLDSETDEIYSAPIQDGNNVNLSDFKPMDWFDYSFDEIEELFNELKNLPQSHLETHTPCATC
jgi:hypothetical protein